MECIYEDFTLLWFVLSYHTDILKWTWNTNSGILSDKFSYEENCVGKVWTSKALVVYISLELEFTHKIKIILVDCNAK